MTTKLIKIEHSWYLPPEAAIKLQKKLSNYVIKKSSIRKIRTVGGVDTGYKNNIAKAVISILSYPDLALMASAAAREALSYPYVPGLLSFREGPVVLKALEHLEALPDLLIFDGQGIAHPRRLGIASHMGVLLDLPTIGCAKTRLVGIYEEPKNEAGHYTHLKDKGETIGAVVRTRSRVKPVFVSIGHKIDLDTSIHYVLNCCRGYRLPETTRLAHNLAAQ